MVLRFFSVAAAVAALVWGCSDFERDNPLDEKGVNYSPPEIMTGASSSSSLQRSSSSYWYYSSSSSTTVYTEYCLIGGDCYEIMSYDASQNCGSYGGIQVANCLASSSSNSEPSGSSSSVVATYALITNVPSGGGTVSISPSSSSYEEGTVVTVTAEPNAGYRFAGWSGALISAEPSIQVTMDENKILIAEFELLNYTLTTSASSGGTVSISPSLYNYTHGTTVTVMATPRNPGYRFVRWSGVSTATTASLTITMDGDKTLIAEFEQIPVVISPPASVPFSDDFEGTNEWTIITSTGRNYWIVGTGTSYAGSRAAYITYNSFDNAYLNSNSTSNIYREITFPSQNTTNFTLSFYYKKSMYVYLVPSSVNVTEARPSNSYLIGFCTSSSSWSQTGLNLGSTYNGGTYKLVFHWSNDKFLASESQIVGQSGAIDDVSIVTTPPPPEIRDYRTITIGEQVWMAENLNYAVAGSRCYDDNPANCTTYGRLYDWATAMVLPSTCTFSTCASQVQAKHQGICPNGWHIPTTSEWNILINYVDGTGGSTYRSSNTAGIYLKAASGWNNNGNGQDTYGFAALPGGYGSNGNFYYVGDLGDWWSATEDNAYYATDYIVRGEFFTRSNNYGKGDDWNSVRCVKD